MHPEQTGINHRQEGRSRHLGRWMAEEEGENDIRTTLLIHPGSSTACEDGLFFLKQISICIFPRCPINQPWKVQVTVSSWEALSKSHPPPSASFYPQVHKTRVGFPLSSPDWIMQSLKTLPFPKPSLGQSFQSCRIMAMTWVGKKEIAPMNYWTFSKQDQGLLSCPGIRGIFVCQHLRQGSAGVRGTPV